MNARVFTSLTHGFARDCRQANAQLQETLECYNFGAFMLERTCTRCPNDDCNLSFVLILHNRDYQRLKRQVVFPVRPMFLVHKSFSELIDMDHRVRRSLLAENSKGIQVGAEMVNKMVDACPSVHNILSQTDFMVGKKDTGEQTENLNRTDAACQSDRIMPPILSISEVKHSESFTITSDNNNNNIEDDDDDDIVFIECRQVAPKNPASREIKQENDEEDVPEPVDIPREVKEEVLEPEEPEEGQRTPLLSEMVSLTSPERTATSMMSPMASAFSSLSTDSYYTPTSINNTSTASTQAMCGSAAKRVKYSDIEICQRCLDVTYFNKLDDFVNHILESHVSISRFKCTACDKKFGSTVSAKHHISRCHRGDPPAEFVPDLSEDSVHKFLATANDCYTDKFRNIQPEEIAEIIQKLP